MTRGPAKQFDRDEVLERAMQLFWHQGYEATGMSELLAHMGIGRQSLYDTFGGKKAIYLEALDRYFEQRLAAARQVLQETGSPLANLRRLFDSMIEMSTCAGSCGCGCGGDGGSCGCFMGNTLAEFGRRDPEMEKVLTRFFGRMAELFGETLTRAKDVGELPADAPVEDIAQMLIVTGQGLALLSKINSDPKMASRLMDTSMAMLTGGATAGGAR